jgi:hypothetical protein
VAQKLPPDTDLTALLQRLDDLLDEATKLRSRVENAMEVSKTSPFWPDRRQQRKPVTRERRR